MSKTSFNAKQSNMSVGGFFWSLPFTAAFSFTLHNSALTKLKQRQMTVATAAGSCFVFFGKDLAVASGKKCFILSSSSGPRQYYQVPKKVIKNIFFCGSPDVLPVCKILCTVTVLSSKTFYFVNLKCQWQY